MEGLETGKQKQRKKRGGLLTRPNMKQKGKDFETSCGGMTRNVMRQN